MNCKYISATFVILFLLAHNFCYLFAQQKKPLLPKSENSTYNQEQTKTDEIIYNPMLLLAGGYFKPLGTEATMFDPSFSLKIMLKQDNLQNTLFGWCGDISYVRLPDNTYKNAYIAYTTLSPLATATLKFFEYVYVQGKAGPGITVLYSKINNKSDSSLSMTISIGAGLYTKFHTHYVFGIEGLYHYYFQIHASTSVDGYIYAGYAF